MRSLHVAVVVCDVLLKTWLLLLLLLLLLLFVFLFECDSWIIAGVFPLVSTPPRVSGVVASSAQLIEGNPT